MSEAGPARVRLTVDPSVGDAVLLGWVAAAPVRVGPSAPALLRAMEQTAERLRRRHDGLAPARIDGLAPARDLYKRFGVDPTKTRPSSEALLRRILRRKPLPTIHNAVDVGNLLSLEVLLPLGLYDVDRIVGSARLRVGAAGESYAGIRKDEVHLEGRLVLADERGPFGNPSSDSRRTAVSPETTCLWMVLFAPRGYPEEEMAAHVALGQRLMETHLAGDRPVATLGGVSGVAESQ